MLYFSDTVWVLTCSSSLPALEGALESSNGEAKGECRLSLFPPSELQLVLLEDIPDAVRDGLSISVYGFGVRPDLEGGSSISADSATPGVAYKPGCPDLDAIDLLEGNNSRAAPGVPGTVDTELSERMAPTKSSPLPELTVM